MNVTILLPGVPVRGSRGYLGWSTVAFMDTGGEGILFDTGSYGDRGLLLEKLREVLPQGMEVKTVVLSHFHFDHCQNVDLFPEARVVISRREWDYVSSGEYKDCGDTFVPGPLFDCLQKGAGSVRLVEDGEEIRPGMVCRLLPGHTPGSMGLDLTADGTLLMGDAVKNGREFVGKDPSYHFASRECWLESWEKVQKASRIIPGHDVPYNLENGKIVGFDPAPPISLFYTPFQPSLDTLLIDKR